MKKSGPVATSDRPVFVGSLHSPWVSSTASLTHGCVVADVAVGYRAPLRARRQLEAGVAAEGSLVRRRKQSPVGRVHVQGVDATLTLDLAGAGEDCAAAAET